MSMVIKVAARAEREEQQEQMQQEFEEAGIVQVLSTIPPFYLTAADDLKALAEIAGTYRCKPTIAPASEEDVPEASESEETTDHLVEFVHHLGYTFNWDDEEHVWCVSGLRDGFTDESADEPAPSRRAAAIEAIRFLAS
jgi:hypothetical protein